MTISVDDGHPLDLRVADLLSKYDLAATFYAPARNPEQPVLSAGQLRDLSKRFELGGHGMNHLPLNTMTDAEAWAEISDGKKWLEDVLGQSVVSFCYPRGKFGPRVASMVKKAGFLGARTCLWNLHEFSADPFTWGVSTQAHDHGKRIQIRHGLLERNFQGLFNFLWLYKLETDWVAHFERALDHVEAKGGIAHLYLHSWETDDCKEWAKLEAVFKTISERPSLARATNGELFAMTGVRHRVLQSRKLGERAESDSPAAPSDPESVRLDRSL